MKKFFTLILFVAIFAVVANAQKELTVLSTNMVPVMDGFIDDIDDPWQADLWVEAAELNSGGQAGTHSAQFQILNSEDFIYVAAKVQDETGDDTAGNTYERDCIEWFFSMNDEDLADGAYQEGSWQVRSQRVAYDALTLGYFDGGTGNAAGVAQLFEDENFTFGTDDSGTEYVWEIAFPKAALAGDADFDDENIKFDIQVANNVGGSRVAQLFWNVNTDQQWQNTKDFGKLVLSTEIVTSAADLDVAKGSAFVKNEMLNIRNVNGTVNVYNLKGSLVRTANVNGSASINIADLNSGMYIVKGTNLTAKVVK